MTRFTIFLLFPHVRYRYALCCTVPAILNANLEKQMQVCAEEFIRVQKEKLILTEMVSGVLQGFLPEFVVMEETLKDALIFLHQYLVNLDLLKVFPQKRT